MKPYLIVILGLLAGISVNAVARTASTKPQFHVCHTTYALCTKAKCELRNGIYECKCVVRHDLSVGKQSCSKVRKMEKTPNQLPSRYHPIRSFVACKGGAKHPWAFCLDSKCTESHDHKHAQCYCSVAHSKYYVYTTDHYTPGLCNSGVVSSASIEDVIGITQWLEDHPKANKGLTPSNITILNVPNASSGKAK